MKQNKGGMAGYSITGQGGGIFNVNSPAGRAHTIETNGIGRRSCSCESYQFSKTYNKTCKHIIYLSAIEQNEETEGMGEYLKGLYLAWLDAPMNYAK